ncbi:M14 family metallopeptidase [Flavobacterium sp.]|uniref:M14 family metallopeptidase n=1 Tax=Flavobacterium sp. TaxID=239 RepID=UPI003D1208BD
MDFITTFNTYKEKSISGRYITNKHIEPILQRLNFNFKVETIGYSVLNKPIKSVRFGTGNLKIFMWSQMHGNESTTTKALFDLFNFLQSNDNEAKAILENYTFLVLPILNPDGAESYTRVNANSIDLNRDSVDLTQPEAQILRKAFEDFKPDFCFNLHDQRTIFGAGATGKPATVSFLAPSYNEQREFNDCRLNAVAIINEMNKVLQQFIPNQVGCFDDAFNLNCIGDYFQSRGVPTILFEAGHFPKDYEREATRKYIFIAILSALKCIFKRKYTENDLQEYLNIPQNKTVFYDFIYKNVTIYKESLEIITNFAAQYKEVLKDEKIFLQAEIIEIGQLKDKFGHVEYDCEQGLFKDDEGNTPKLGKNANFSIKINNLFTNGVKIN